MFRYLLAALLAFAGLDYCVNAQNIETAKRCQSSSVLIQTEFTQNGKKMVTTGSGTVFQYSGETYVWTNDHVVEDARSTTTVNAAGQQHIVTTIVKVKVSQKLTGKSVEFKSDAEIVKFSDIKTGHDLALLKLPKVNPFAGCATAFREGDEPSPVGTEVYIVGCPDGDSMRQSIMHGIVAYNDREMTYTIRKPIFSGFFVTYDTKEVNPRIFDQTDAQVAGGNSGGGVFDKETGEFLGILSRKYESNGHGLYIPIRRMREWAKSESVEWALENPQPELADESIPQGISVLPLQP